MFDLMRCDGPACPQCGCTDAKIIQPATGGFAHGVAICGFCGRRFSFTIPKETAGSAADNQDGQTDDQARRRRKRS
jgi:transcription elongation factor Elf1